MSDEFYEFEEEEFASQHTGRTFGRILRLTRPHWRWVVGFLVCIASVSLMDAYLTYINKQIIDNAIIPGDRNALVQLALIYGGVILISAVFVFGFIYLAGVLGERIRYDLRRTMFNHLQDLSLSYYNQTPVGWIMSRVTSDSDRVAELVTWGLLDVSWGIMNILTATFFMLIINWRLGIAVFAIFPILVVVGIWFQGKILKQFRESRKFNSKITSSYNENITGVRVVKALGREDENIAEFKVKTGQMYASSYRAAWLSALFLPTVQIISSFALAAVVWYGGMQVKLGGMTIGGIQAFVTYIIFMMWPIQEMARVFAEMQQAIASGERMFSLMDAVPAVTNRPDAQEVRTIRGRIEFEHVNFTYEDGKPVLTDFSLKVEPGETIALVGPTGGGKTTIVNLLCRFFEPVRGVIRINGQDYTRLSLHAIQSRIGIVLQTPHLFSGSIRENIRYGKLDATDEEIEAAARLAGAEEFIKSFGKGYDEQVGEGGNLLSTGQKQLVSLARAVLSQPEIFIMDEATSSVDTLTEALIQKGMDNLMKARTSFIIAHRLSTIRKASRILVIEGGRIAEMGTHAELLRQRGHYYRLYTQQFRYELEQGYGDLPLDEYAPAL